MIIDDFEISLQHRSIARDGIEIRLTEPQFIIAVALLAARGAHVTASALVDRVCRRRKDGGALSAECSTRVNVMRLRPALATLGVEIERHEIVGLGYCATACSKAVAREAAA
jgi:DNA-binding response OmpR family regulator